MLDKLFLVLFSAALALAPSAWAQTRVQVKAGGQGNVTGDMTQPARPVSGGPVKIDLSVPALGPGLGTGFRAPDLRTDSGAEALPAQTVLDLELPILPALARDVQKGILLGTPGETDRSEKAKPAVQGTPQWSPAVPGMGGQAMPGDERAGRAAVVQPDEAKVHAGRVMFDQAGDAPLTDLLPAPSLWQKLKAAVLPDIIPSWPGREGETLRIEGRSYALNRRIGESHVSTVWSVNGTDRHVVKLIRPEFKDDPHYGREVDALEALSHTKVAHARLVAHANDGLVLVKERIGRWDIQDLVREKRMTNQRRSTLAGLAASLIFIGYTADLAPANLRMEVLGSKWVLIDAGGFMPGTPMDVLGQLWREEYFGEGAADAKLQFLTNLRIRLGAESKEWKEIVKNAPKIPSLRNALKDLARADAGRAPPEIVFEGEPDDPVFTNRQMSAREIKKRIGYYPDSVKDKHRIIHDSGKLNTELWQVNRGGEKAEVLKLADRYIIRNELAGRRILNRWFGKYLDSPDALGYGDGMVMQHSDGGMTWTGTRLTLPQRVAFAILAHGFGVTDVNAGNVLYRKDGQRPHIIDFEQSMKPAHVTFSRLKIDGILEEMPWVSGRERNHIQDYLPAIQEWRALVSQEDTVRELEQIFLDSGFEAKEIPNLIAVIQHNAKQLELNILADVEYANDYVADRQHAQARAAKR